MDSQYIVSQTNSLARSIYAALGFPPTQATEFHASDLADEKQCWELAAMSYRALLNINPNDHLPSKKDSVAIDAFTQRINSAANDGKKTVRTNGNK